MKKSIFKAVIAASTFLGGCSLISGDAVDPTDPCGAQGYSSFLGSNVAAITLPEDLNHRVVAPDTLVTTDFDPSRLNIETTADGLVIGLSCG